VGQAPEPTAQHAAGQCHTAAAAPQEALCSLCLAPGTLQGSHGSTTQSLHPSTLLPPHHPLQGPAGSTALCLAPGTLQDSYGNTWTAPPPVAAAIQRVNAAIKAYRARLTGRLTRRRAASAWCWLGAHPSRQHEQLLQCVHDLCSVHSVLIPCQRA